MSKRIIVDVDGTLWDLHTPLIKALSESHPGFPTEMPTEWNWFQSYISNAQFAAMVRRIHDVQYAFRPFDGAAYLFDVLAKHTDLEIFVASHRDRNTASTLSGWLQDNRCYPYSCLYTGPDKLDFLRSGDIIIDDAPKTILNSIALGADVYYLEHPWNAELPGHKAVTLFEIANAIRESK